ncbi:MAG: CDP-alcohol phosphatidyltransferase family protein [Acidobacteria bacterium]|nr:CDP-alcohol phosphatidyltransferase family protein [Acidobacteriota bacterium]
MEELTFQPAVRAQCSLLAGAEKRCLVWLAERMPAWVKPDHLTALGLLAMLLAGLSYWLARWNRYALLLVVFWLAVNWFGDSLDGTLARVRRQERPRYGFYVDHVVDAFATLFLLGGLALSGLMSAQMALGVLIAYFLLCIEVYLATYTLGTFRLSLARISPTELRILLAVGNLVLLSRPVLYLGGQAYRLFDVGGLMAIVAMVVVLLISVAKNALTLYRAERLP